MAPTGPPQQRATGRELGDRRAGRGQAQAAATAFSSSPRRISRLQASFDAPVCVSHGVTYR